MRPTKRALITDLDNTLFDWVEVWYRCFRAMLDEIVVISGIPERDLIPAIKEVHKRHGTSEYSFLIEEVPSLRKGHSTDEILSIYQSAIQAYREQRRQHLKLYPSVADTLLYIKGRGSRIIGYTESMAFYSNYRIRRLGLDGVLDEVFSPSDHDIPSGMTPDQIRRYPAEHYKFRYTTQEHTPRGSKKPNSEVLRAIIDKAGLTPEECVYIGDSLFKDIPMAQDLGVSDVLAGYGVAQGRPEYSLLVAVTHWSDEEVRFESEIRKRPVRQPSVVLSRFDELLSHFVFKEHS